MSTNTSNDELWNGIRGGGIDPNHQELFFLAMIKGMIYDLNKTIKVRDKYVPHFIVNTGDDTMYLMVKGQDQSLEPMETTNEKYVYSCVPRCIVTTGGISIPTDQLTAPYAMGEYQIEHDGKIRTMSSEFRRIPLNMSVTLKYFLDTFTDSLEITQEIISKMAFINVYKFVYMGQVLPASYTLPDSQDIESILEFDGLSTDSKTRNISIDMTLEGAMPVYFNRAAIPSDKRINMYYKDDGLHRAHAPAARVTGDADGTTVLSNIGDERV